MLWTNLFTNCKKGHSWKYESSFKGRLCKKINALPHPDSQVQCCTFFSEARSPVFNLAQPVTTPEGFEGFICKPENF